MPKSIFTTISINIPIAIPRTILANIPTKISISISATESQ